jgi:hypothetical protein
LYDNLYYFSGNFRYMYDNMHHNVLYQ